MSTYRLDRLFSPRSVAVLGASPRAGSLGLSVLRNIVAAGFPGRIDVVSPKHPRIDQFDTVRRLADLSEPPDLVVLATPPETIPALIDEAGAKGAAAAIIITAGLGHGSGSLAEATDRAARRHGLRLVGPNCLGAILPYVGLNASFAARMPNKGDLALVSQSGAVVAGMVEWAARRAIGFSAAISLGDKIDVDFGDALDYFATDRTTRAILLYVESIRDARKFMSAARAAARVKPVVIVKSGRHASAAKAAATHTGALAGSDAVYDAAFRRAGLLRVYDLNELFDAAQTLGSIRPFDGERLAILTNGGGVGVLAVDRLIDLDGTLAPLSDETRTKLDAVLPPTWSGANPVDIIGDADADRYAAAMEALLADTQNDAILVMNVPTTLASSSDTAQAVAKTVQTARTQAYSRKPVLAVWVGDDGAAASTFAQGGIPSYATEAAALSGFMQMVRYRRAQHLLMQTPASLPADFVPDVRAARRLIQSALAEDRTWLDPVETAQLFEAYAIPIVPALLARDGEEAARVSVPMFETGGTVAVKILSRDIVHKSDVGGVQLNLTSPDAVRRAADDIIARARSARPHARIAGVSIHPMITRPKARELIAGIADDPTFGPVIAFGRGGTAVEVINDKALALPPLDMTIAHDLIGRTRVARRLKAYRNIPAADTDAIALMLVKLAQLAADFPEIREVDINPLLADETGVIAVDARVAVAPTAAAPGHGNPRFAIRPYPKQWERQLTLADGTPILVRPVRPEDEGIFETFFTKVTPDDLRLRFFSPVKEFSHSFIARLTQLDYARSMAFVALHATTGEMLGAVRLHADANHEYGEYAILLRSDLKGRGLGWALMQYMIEFAREDGLRRIEGQVLAENTVMLEMCDKLGFDVANDPHEPGLKIVSLPLD